MKRLLYIFLLALLAAGPRAAAQGSLQGELDNWRSYTVFFIYPRTAPNGWTGSDSLAAFLVLAAGGTDPAQQVFKETSIVHGGAAAAKLVTRTQASFIVPGVIGNAQVVISDLSDPFGSLSFQGGLPISARVDSVSAWVRYEPKGADEGYLLAQAVSTRGTPTTDDDTIVGVGTFSVPATGAGYVRINAKLEYITTAIAPDRLIVAASSGSLDPDVITDATDSSTLYIDDITYTSALGIERPVRADAPSVRIFPNPATEALRVEVESPDAMHLSTYDAAGRVVSMLEFRRSGSVDVHRLPAGLYTYRIHDGENRFVQSGTFSVAQR